MQEPPEGMLKAIKVIDTFSEWSGKAFAWMIVPLVLALTYEVVARYGFDAPTIWAYDVSYMVFFFPGLIFFFFAGWDAAWHSWQMREASEVSAWRPALYPFKFVMPVTAVLLLIQGTSEFIKSVWAAKTGRWL